MTDQLYCPACGPDWHGAYDMNHRCVECGMALRAEKVMERLKAVEEERDALARDLEAERCHRQAIERSDQALAAHVEAGSRIANEWKIGAFGDAAAAVQFDEWLHNKPTTSLARLKAELQAEALESVAVRYGHNSQYPQYCMHCILESEAVQLRHQSQEKT